MMTRVTRAIVVLAVISAFPTNLPAQTSEAESRPNLIQGTVVNSSSHEPVGRALVYSPDNRYATMTDSEGHFELNLSQAAIGNDGQNSSSSRGPIWLLARRPGFLEGQHEASPVEVSAGSDVTISLMPEALIKGRVTLGPADPGHGVNVQLYRRQVVDGSSRWTMKNSAMTNSNGEFRFAELEPGSYKVFTSEWMDNDPAVAVQGGELSGFPPVYYPGASDFAAASTIQVRAGETVEADLPLIRQPYYLVKIPVASAEPIQGLSVTVSPQGQRGPGYTLGYNRVKNEIGGQLPNGKYLVEASSFGLSSASGAINLTVAGAAAQGPTLVLSGNISIPVNVKEEFTSDQSAGSSGDTRQVFRLAGSRGDLQINAESVEEFAEHRNASARVPTHGDEPLVLENLLPGRYWLRLRPNHGYVASASMGGTDLLREPLVVVPGASGSIDITMRDDSAQLEGTVTTATSANTNGAPENSTGATASNLSTSSLSASNPVASSPSAYIYCIPLPDNPGQYIELAASADGKFAYPTITPGVYRVIAFNTQQHELPYRDAEAMKTFETKGQVVHFAPGQKLTLQLQAITGSE